jgi:hypothetical protein
MRNVGRKDHLFSQSASISQLHKRQPLPRKALAGGADANSSVRNGKPPLAGPIRTCRPLRIRTRLAQRRGDAGSNMIGRAAQRVSVQMRVALRRTGARVPQQLADDRQTQACAGAKTRMGMPEVVNAHASETGPFGDRAPWSVEVGAGPLAVRAGALPSNGVGADAIEPREHRKCRCIQNDRFRTGLAVGEQ